MAKNIKGITIEIDGKTTGLDKALGDVNKRSNSLQRELKEVEKLLKFNPGNTELLAQKQKILQTQLVNTASKLDKLRDAQRQVDEQFRNGKISEEQYRAFQREVVQTEGKLQSLERQLNDTGDEAKNAGRDFDKAGESLKSAGDKMQGAGRSLTTGVTAPLAAMGGFAVKTAMDFEAQISRVGAIAGASAKELDALRDSALDLGASTSKSASEVAIAQENLAALGFTVDDILGAMPGVISAAEASGSDMALTAEVMASAINIFGLEASEATRVADILAQTANQSAADINDMGYALKYAGPVAANLGVSMEELSASIGIMTDAGLDGSSAGTALRAGLLALLKPSEENSKKMAAMGIEMEDANGKFVGIKGVIDQLNGSMEGMTDAQKTATLASLVGTEASSGFLALMAQGPAEIEKMTKALEDSGGASADTAKKMKDNLKGSLDELSGAFETMQIAIGTALTPAIEKLAAFLQRLVDWFNQLSPAGQQLAVIFGAVAAAVGPLMIALGFIVSSFGSLLPVIAKVIPYLTSASKLFGAIKVVLAALTGPIGLAILAIVALGAAFLVLWNRSETFRAGITAAWEQIKQAALSVFSFLQPYIQQAMTAVMNLVQSVLSQISAFWSQNGAMIIQAVQNIWTFIGIAFNAIAAIIKFIWPAVIAIIRATWAAIQNVIQGGVKVITGIIQAFSALFTGNWSQLWAAVKQIVMGGLQLVWGLINLYFLGRLLGPIKSFGSLAGSSIRSAWNFIKQIFTSSISNIRNIVTTGFNAVKSSISSILNGAKSIVSSIFSGMRNGISSTVSSIRSTVSSTFQNVRNAIINPIQAAHDKVIGIIDRIKSAFANMKITIPKPKLPKVNVSMGSKEVAGVSIPFPQFDVSWFKKGGVFGGPSVIGVGEEPGVSEAVIPLKPSVLSKIGQGIAATMGEAGASGAIELTVNLDGYTIAKVTQPYIDRGQESKTNMKSYMKGVK